MEAIAGSGPSLSSAVAESHLAMVSIGPLTDPRTRSVHPQAAPIAVLKASLHKHLQLITVPQLVTAISVPNNVLKDKTLAVKTPDNNSSSSNSSSNSKTRTFKWLNSVSEAILRQISLPMQLSNASLPSNSKCISSIRTRYKMGSNVAISSRK